MQLNEVNNNNTQIIAIDKFTAKVNDFGGKPVANGGLKAVTVNGHVHVERKWNVGASNFARSTNNRIRSIVENLKIQPNPEKPMIPLTIGDPTTFGNLKADDAIMRAVQKAFETGTLNGYAHSLGTESARKAIAKYSAHQSPNGVINVENVMICSGCSAALEYCLLTLAEPGQNILLPRPGFCLYQTLIAGMGIEARYYDLLPERQWQADLNDLEKLIDDKTAALLINNPSNPCGIVFSKKYLEQMINICERHCLPIIADEIYEHFVFPGSKYYSVSSLSKNVPVLSCSGLAKRFLVPGWRVGWIIVHDRHNRLGDVAKGIKNLCSRILGATSIVQGGLPEIFKNTPKTFYDEVIKVLYANAKLAFRLLSRAPGLKPVMPNGAMYMMVGMDIENFPEFEDDMSFVQELVNEQSVFCLPGNCFDVPNFMRIVLTIPEDMMEEACSRIVEFCEHHYKIDNSIIKNGLP